ncbi:HNH endonuclease [Neobacillus drentensis]|uniref:HNH endonuclease n=1 Tax=Neobacillus drentensis TaxID=220684 RepID=UPI002FFEF44B
MLKSCAYCGGIHQRNHKCGSRPKRKKEANEINKFRWSTVWMKKRKCIRERDKHLCQICLLERYNTQNKYNFHNIEVHHIVPLIEAWDKRLKDSNLISLCAYHHKMAESGQIPKNELIGIVRQIV